MFTVAICDDSKDIQNEMSRYVDDILKEKNAEFETLIFSNGQELFGWIEDNDNPIELLFLDIEMPGMTGVEIKADLEKNNQVKRVIFATSHYENMQEAFGAKVIGFMLKPLQPKEVSRRLENAYKEYEDDSLIELSKDVFVKKSEISYIKSEGNYCDFFCVNGRKISAVRNPLSHYKELFGDTFIQVHKSYIVNAFDIKKNSSSSVVLSNSVEVQIGRSYTEAFRNAYRTIAMQNARERF